MDPRIKTLLDEVPADFVPKYDEASAGDRVVGNISDLGADTQRMVVGLYYYLELGETLHKAHKRRHLEPDFKGGEICVTHRERMVEMVTTVNTLRGGIAPAAMKTFSFMPGESIGFRPGGVIVASTPEPEDIGQQLMAMLGIQTR